MLTIWSENKKKFFEEKGYNVAHAYDVNGVTYWNVDIADDAETADKIFKDPEFVQITLEDGKLYPQIVANRFAPKLFTLKHRGKLAYTPRADGNGFSVPISKDPGILREAFTNPETGECPKVEVLKTKQKILKTFQQHGKSAEISHITFYMQDQMAENFDLRYVTASLQTTHSPDQVRHGFKQLRKTPPNTTQV